MERLLEFAGNHPLLVSAFFLFTVNIIGTGFGATVIAVVTDLFFPEGDGVRYSLAICTPIIYLLAAFCFWRATHHFRDHLKILGAAGD